ncbi:MAG: fibronectin type III domain-containing protein, partial [Bacteroidetes bacterium]|nr:fibronectin type III domain-containing protein [Bacteroidota bacterium]
YQVEVSSTDFTAPTLLPGYPLTVTDASSTIGVDAGTTALTPGTSYWIRLRSRNSSGESPNSNVAAVLTKPATPVLNPVATTDIDQTSASLSWAAVSGIVDTYVMDVSKDGFQTFQTGFNGLSISATSIIVTGLDPGTDYEVWLRSENSSGQSPNSSAISFLTIPANPTATSAAAIASNAFQATWDAVTGADFYILEVSNDDFSSTILQDTVTNQLFADVTGLSAGTQYQYRVQSGNTTGISGVSNIVVVTTEANVAPLSLALAYSDKFPEGQTSATITVSTSGGSGNLSLAIRNKGILAVSYGPDQTLTANTNGDYEFTVTSAMLDEMGIQFEVEVTDGNDIVTKAGNIFRTFDEAQSPLIPFEKFGGSDDSWNLFSIPYELDNKSISTIFADYDPARHEYDWRIMRYRNSSNDYVNFNTGQVKAGVAYWFNAKEKIAIKTGAGQVVSQIPFSMGLVKGWNLVGNPYNVSISWNSVITANGEDGNIEAIYMYIPGSVSFQQGDVIQPFSGGFVWTEAATTLSISPVDNSTGLRIKSKKIVNRNIDDPEWILPITIKNEKNSFQQVAVGMHPEAREGKDEFDQMTLPRFFNYLEMYATHNSYFYPWFSEDITQTEEEYSWRFTMESDIIGEKVFLDWDQSVMQNKISTLLLVDEKEGRIIDMKEAGNYTFTYGEKRSFTIYYSLDPSRSFIPSSIMLGNAYPNPATSTIIIPVTLPDLKDRYHISLVVYNMQGQKIKTLANGHFAPGFYEFEWEEIEKSSTPNGIYLYRLVFEDPEIESAQKRIIIQR